MSLASDTDLAKLIASDDLRITMPPELSDIRAEYLQPASADVHLDHYFKVMTRYPQAIDLSIEQANLFRDVEVEPGDCFLLRPGQFALGSILQHVSLSDRIAAQLDGRSSVGRIGVPVHCTAGWLDPGFRGHVTLELYNQTQMPVTLWPGMGIGQLIVSMLTTPARAPYGAPGLNSHYQDQGRGPKVPAAWRNWSCLPTRAKESA